MRFILLSVTPFICFMAGYLMMQQIVYTPSVTVPDLIGLPLSTALIRLNAIDVYGTSIAYREESDIPADIVVEQLPHAGSRIKPRQAVILTSSAIPTIPQTPQLMGTHYSRLAALPGIRIRTHPLPCPITIGHCYAQYPFPGSPLDQDSIEAYYSSEEPVPRIMPNLKGLPAISVTDWLTQLSLKWRIFHPRTTESPATHTCTSCYISEQSPAPGSVIMDYKTVSIQLLASPQLRDQ